mmetsp:Transcript_26076/g.40958  ORF Transcript_26076/g.40958 Transcript_26076/m.40958 type:complete len:156 (-) Transcript_26076:153-620(-)|eukprot:CAMPEP_0201735874 /NCGR_PEP_ID=MMETSP0593-20130828/38207_1 /ASSEMBLY_ACC=CAM_ASM_000672 /TAXON_ID=267983 /ORGANISM="Skeletonema japonicum, Strain CCMP2506" /LENGTH=155 /DNA_ID=CAMNT_0048229505 /DNA_START=191 /DNA_END=658 /DNA_ORIENTATION=+
MPSTKKKQSKSAFSKHTEQQLQPPTSNNNDAPANTSGDFGQMSLTGRLLVFLLVPTSTGLIGLFSSFLQSTRPKENEGDEPHTIDLDRDFVTPFLLGLALVIVVGFQTKGFTVAGGMSGMERQFALQWPKARRVRKIRRERVIVEDEDVDDKKER